MKKSKSISCSAIIGIAFFLLLVCSVSSIIDGGEGDATVTPTASPIRVLATKTPYIIPTITLTITPTELQAIYVTATKAKYIAPAPTAKVHPTKKSNSEAETYPQGITAVCKDGTYSYSQNASGTCSHHGGVKKWVNKP